MQARQAALAAQMDQAGGERRAEAREQAQIRRRALRRQPGVVRLQVEPLGLEQAPGIGGLGGGVDGDMGAPIARRR
jgi:hypothetical protein